MKLPKAYKLYNPFTQKVKISRDVVFDEESTWNWNEKSSIPLTFDGDEDDEVEDELTRQPHTHNIEEPSNQIEISPSEHPPVNHAENEGRPRRNRRRPEWMKDYDVTGIDQDEDSISFCFICRL